MSPQIEDISFAYAILVKLELKLGAKLRRGPNEASFRELQLDVQLQMLSVVGMELRHL